MKTLEARCALDASGASRRRVVTAGAALLFSPFAAWPGRARCDVPALRALSFRHTHTGESLSIAYASGDTYLDAALQRINWFLRDFRNGETHAIDPKLLDQLHRLYAISGSRAPYEVISGYRSQATNDYLRRKGGGVATYSLHLEGRAIDIRLRDIALADLRDAAVALDAGGVGFYPKSQFIHLDTGGVRHW